MCGALVCILPFVTMRPFSVFTPAFSSPSNAVFGTRPSAKRISSAEMETALPPCSNEISFIVGQASSLSIFRLSGCLDRLEARPTIRASSSFVPVKTWMPSRRKTFSISVPASASNSFKTCPLRWMSVTLTPKRAKNCANSHAIAPPPRTMSDLGNRFSASASSLVRQLIS